MPSRTAKRERSLSSPGKNMLDLLSHCSVLCTVLINLSSDFFALSLSLPYITLKALTKFI